MDAASKPPACRVLRALGPLLASLLLVLTIASSAHPQGFGRNKVQYDTFDWQVLVTDHLEVHFYPEEEALARRAAEYGEAACRRLDAELGHTLSKRIPLIVYGSHYHFRQNNVSPGLVREGTGGFTEIFRTRIALPYAGSEEDFRHVVHHELVHAYVFDMLWGGPIKSLFVLQYAFYVPLWFMEGLAEYYSNRWDSEAEMMLRDAAISGALPPFDRIHGGYFVYKSGWSAVGYLVDRHGEGVIAEILASLPETRDLRESIRQVTGEDIEKIAGEWLKDVRRCTWPAIAELDGPEAFGRLLGGAPTKDGTMDYDPVLSPSGRAAVFLSNRSGTPDLWWTDLDGDAPPRVLVRGARGGKFESLHPLRSAVGWSPDERYVVAAAQKGAADALYVLEARTGRTVEELELDLDAVERPDWSPVNARFVFTGLKNGQVDLWAVDADGTRVERLTNDLAREEAPRFSPDGRHVVYAREAGDVTGRDLWMLDLDSGQARPLRVAPGDQWDPCWSADGHTVYHVSDEHGTRDLMALGRDDGSVRRLTALVGGADSPSTARKGSRLVFAVYHEGGSRLVLVEDADTLRTVEASPVRLDDVPWRGHTLAPTSAESPGVSSTTLAAAAPSTAADTSTAAGASPAPPDIRLTDYHPRFRSEWISGAAFYDGFGASASLAAAVSDILGNHRFQVGMNLFRSLENADAFLTYSYLPRRLDFSFGVFHVRDYFYDDRTSLGQPIGEEGAEAFFSERRWGALAAVTYPFHTFRRVGLDVSASEVERVVYTEESRRLGAEHEEVDTFRGRILLPRLHHAFDNTLWGWTGPVQGHRSVLSLQHSVPLGGERISFGTALADARWYFRFSGDYIVALRGMAAASFGRDPQQFQLGGPNTLRGFPRQVFHGRHAALVSAEFRYPFLEYVRLGWPFRSAFGGVRGNLFVDAGAAFDEPQRFRAVGRTGDGVRGLEDLHVSFGVGARARVAFFPVRADVGWPVHSTVGRPVWHVTIAPEF